MRRVFFVIIIAILAFSFTSLAQNKRDKIITVSVSDTVQLFPRIVTILFDNGYYPDFRDDQAGLLLTKEKEFNTYSIRIKIKISDSTIIVTGEGKFWSLSKGGKDDTYEPIYYGGMKGSDLRNAWVEIDKIAHQFGSKIKYSK